MGQRIQEVKEQGKKSIGNGERIRGAEKNM